MTQLLVLAGAEAWIMSVKSSTRVISVNAYRLIGSLAVTFFFFVCPKHSRLQMPCLVFCTFEDGL